MSGVSGNPHGVAQDLAADANPLDPAYHHGAAVEPAYAEHAPPTRVPRYSLASGAHFDHVASGCAAVDGNDALSKQFRHARGTLHDAVLDAIQACGGALPTGSSSVVSTSLGVGPVERYSHINHGWEPDYPGQQVSVDFFLVPEYDPPPVPDTSWSSWAWSLYNQDEQTKLRCHKHFGWCLRQFFVVCAKLVQRDHALEMVASTPEVHSCITMGARLVGDATAIATPAAADAWRRSVIDASLFSSAPSVFQQFADHYWEVLCEQILCISSEDVAAAWHRAARKEDYA